MNEATCQRLLEVNREFYATIASVFNQTRMVRTPGLQRLLELVPNAEADAPVRVLDVGCGNGRFAWMLDSSSRAFDYTGVDGAAELLELATENTRAMKHGQARFHLADLAMQGWSNVISDDDGHYPQGLTPPQPSPTSGRGQATETQSRSFYSRSLPRSRGRLGGGQTFDFVLCTATLQHLPSYQLRLAAVREMASLTDQTLVLSGWQFLSSERLVEKVLPWESVGLTEADVDPGDALLPWKQETYAIRYVHQIDEGEMRRLTEDAGLSIRETFRADGREGNLNLYAVLGK